MALSVMLWGEEGYKRFQLLLFAEPDLDLSAPAQGLDPDGQFERLAHEPRGFVELDRRLAPLLGLRLARFLGSGEVFANQFFGLPDGEPLDLDPLCQVEHLVLGLETQQRPGVSFGELPFLE